MSTIDQDKVHQLKTNVLTTEPRHQKVILLNVVHHL